jgi:glutathione S-transferase
MHHPVSEGDEAMTAADEDAIILYSMTRSGHGHRVRLFLSLIGLPHRVIHVEPEGGLLKTPRFLSMNPFGQVPILIDGTTVLHESNAILVYLARKYADPDWLPDDPLGMSQVQQWLSLASGPITYGPCAARRIVVYGETLVDMETAQRIALDLLDTIELLFARRSFAIGEKPTIADVAAYTYIAHAPEGGISLNPYPHIRRWIAQVESLPGFSPMPSASNGISSSSGPCPLPVCS